MTDELDALVDAYRAEADSPLEDAPKTRRAILRVSRERRQRRTVVMAAMVTAALVLTNATTFAWSTGRLDGLQQTVSAWLHGAAGGDLAAASTEPPAPSAETSFGPAAGDARVSNLDLTRRLSAHVPASQESTPDATRRDRQTERPTADDHSEAGHGPPARTPAEASNRPLAEPPPESPPSASPAVDGRADLGPDLGEQLDALAPPPSRERRVFERAHRAHFEVRDYAAALSAWDTYLHAYPSGRLLPEARFNRAVCLLRLGRFDAAEQTLSHIASGEGPRQREAQDLLRALAEGRIRRAPAR